MGDQRTKKLLRSIAEERTAPSEVHWAAIHAIDMIHLRGLRDDNEKTAFLKSRLNERGTLYWAIIRLKELESREAIQALVDAARSSKADDASQISKHYARDALIALYDGGSGKGADMADEMIKSGVVAKMPY